MLLGIKQRRAFRRLRGLLEKSRKKALNEADTRNLVERFLETVLGYDLISEISAEEAVEHRAADYAVRVNKRIGFLVEIKSLQTRLKDNHVFQVKNYAASKGVPWCVLTNGIDYRLYHVEFSEAVKHELVFEANLIDDPAKAVEEKIQCLTRRGIAGGQIDKLWRRQRCFSETGLLGALLSRRVLAAMRRQINHDSRQRVSEMDVARALKRMFSEQLYEAFEELAAKLQRKRRRPSRRPALAQAVVKNDAAVPSLVSQRPPQRRLSSRFPPVPM